MSIHQALEQGEPDNAYWPPGAKNPAERQAMVRSDMAPLLRILGSGSFNPGSLRPHERSDLAGGKGGVRNSVVRILACASCGSVYTSCPLRYMFSFLCRAPGLLSVCFLHSASSQSWACQMIAIGINFKIGPSSSWRLLEEWGLLKPDGLT